MRIISGYLKGKNLSFINSQTTRPLRDMVKEGVFNILEHSKLVDVKIKNSEILDLYSGVGSFGIECISRNAKHVTFVEQNIDARSILVKNFEKLLIKEKIFLYSGTVRHFLEKTTSRIFDIIFIDPPYQDKNFLKEIETLSKMSNFNKEHIVVLHRESKENENLSSFLDVLMIKQYGRSKIYFGRFN